MLIIFDKDNTLIAYHQRPANTPEEQILLPGVAKKCASLRQEGHTLAIASNQGGVAWGFISYAQAELLLLDCAKKIGASSYRFCPHDPRKGRACHCRKPKPGMLLSLMQEFASPPQETLFIGDRKEDQQAATAANCNFCWAETFFTT